MSFQTLANQSKLKIIKFLLLRSNSDFFIRELGLKTGLSRPTIIKHIKELEKEKIVVVSRHVGNATLYRVNLDHPLIVKLKEIL